MDFSKLESCIEKIAREYNIPGADCLVYKEHEVIFRYFTGMSDIENNKKMNGDELYLIFSMTKMITCTAALQLFEKGKYQMSDSLAKYLPEFEKMKISYDEIDISEAEKITTGSGFGESVKADREAFATKQITIKDLFTMGTGLDYALSDEAITNAINAGKTTTRELVGAMADKALGFEPGTRFRYSLCHDVIGALIEIWSGERLGEYMRKNIFEPLGMENTFFGVTKDEYKLTKMAARYTTDESGVLEKLPLECVYNLAENYESGGAGLTSSVNDYAIFLDALACGGVGKNGKRILKEETIKLMSQNHLNEKQLKDFYQLRKGYGYGLGVRTHIDKEASGSISPLGEFGWDGAAGAFSMVDTKNKISLAYFQHFHKWDTDAHKQLRNALYECLGL